MSSDESGGEDGNDVLYAQGYAWRSRRLLCLYSVLDIEAAADGEPQTRRKKTRIAGRHKEGLYLPPKGVASWMISRRWLSDLQTTNPDSLQQVYAAIEDPPDCAQAIGTCNLLGGDSDTEGS